jgi:hypothetical protein
MGDIIIIEKYKSNFNYKEIFDFDFERTALVTNKCKKVYVKDIEIDIKEIKEKYKYIILVGAEPAKMVANISPLSEYQGYLVDSKYLAITNPVAVSMRPALEPAYLKAIKDINSTISGTKADSTKLDVEGIQDTSRAVSLIKTYIEMADSGILKYLAVDTETSALSPRRGYVLGISLSIREKQGVYIDSDYIDEEVSDLLQILFNKVVSVFFNAKFDIKMLEYHFGFNFPEWEDVMLLHYVLDESTGTHKLKPLAIKYTDLGDYDRELEEFKRSYCKRHSIKLKDFSYDLIPFNIMYKYAALDTAATIELFFKFYKNVYSLNKFKIVYERLLKRGTRFLIDMEENGIPINVSKAANYIKEINKEIERFRSIAEDVIEDYYGDKRKRVK